VNENLEIDAACRGRIPVRGRSVGRRLQDRRPAPATWAGIVWRMDPGQGEGARTPIGASRCGGNFVISVANHSGAAHRHQQGDRQGRVGRPTSSDGQNGLQFTAGRRSPVKRQDRAWALSRRRQRRGVPSHPPGSEARPPAKCCGKKIRHSGAGASLAARDLEGQEQLPGRPGRRPAMLGDGFPIDGPPHQSGAVGATGKFPVPWSDPYYRPGDNLYNQQPDPRGIPDSGKMNWYHQYHAGRTCGTYDEEGLPHPDRRQRSVGQAAQARHLTQRANGFPLFLRARANGPDP